jgi:hypothetical protein
VEEGQKIALKKVILAFFTFSKFNSAEFEMNCNLSELFQLPLKQEPKPWMKRPSGKKNGEEWSNFVKNGHYSPEEFFSPTT